MGLNQGLKKLYNAYEEIEDFVRGGVIYEEKYLNSDKKVLMLLKEVNNSQVATILESHE
jgi:hypothetical protein